jgi:hypothetical protein
MNLHSEGLHDKREVATWRLGNILAFSSRREENKKMCAVTAGNRTFSIQATFLPAPLMAWLH